MSDEDSLQSSSQYVSCHANAPALVVDVDKDIQEGLTHCALS